MKRLARATRSWRITVGLADEADLAPTRLARSRTRRALPGGRVAALETDIENVVEAWNRHLPQILSEIGEARRVGAEARQAREDVARLEAVVAELKAIVEAKGNATLTDTPATGRTAGTSTRRRTNGARSEGA
jgi:hypothetical protein